MVLLDGQKMKSIIIYDRYDLWEFDPDKGMGRRLTKGRENKVTYRYVKLNSDQDYIDKKRKILLTTFNNIGKNSGYFEYDYNRRKVINYWTVPIDFQTR